MGPSGLEPLTFAMSTQRSNQLSYEPVKLIIKYLTPAINLGGSATICGGN